MNKDQRMSETEETAQDEYAKYRHPVIVRFFDILEEQYWGVWLLLGIVFLVAGPIGCIKYAYSIAGFRFECAPLSFLMIWAGSLLFAGLFIQFGVGLLRAGWRGMKRDSKR